MEREIVDNLLPVSYNNIEIEKNILSQIIKNKDSLNQVLSQITEDYFFDERHVVIFMCIRELFLSGGTNDIYSIVDYLTNTGRLAKAGGAEYVYSLSTVNAIKSSLPAYIRILKDESKKRNLASSLKEIEKKLQGGVSNPETLIDLGISMLSEIKETEGDVGFEALSDILKKNINEIALSRSGETNRKIILSGFKHLDKIIGGFRPGTLNIIAARPGMGKTALVINIATNVALFKNTPVNIFSLEMSKSEIGNRILASKANSVTASKIQRAKISDEEFSKIKNAYKNLSALPIYIDDRSSVNPVSMLSKLKELKSQGRLGLVIVDYLQLMDSVSRGSNGSRQQEISDISRSLKVLAKDMDVPVIALSQLSRGAEKRDDHTPVLSDLRDSGAIEQDADSVIFIDRDSYYKKKEEREKVEDAKLIVAKNRHGEVGIVKLKWWGEKTLFFEEDNISDPKDPGTTGQGSSFTRTTSADRSSSNYSFEQDSSYEDSPPPFDIDEPPQNPENDDFFADAEVGFGDEF